MTRVLILEDDPLVQRSMLRCLKRDGYEAVGVPKMADAIEVWSVEHFDAVVSDIDLPDGSGLGFFKWLGQPRYFILHTGNSTIEAPAGVPRFIKPDMQGVVNQLNSWFPPRA